MRKIFCSFKFHFFITPPGLRFSGTMDYGKKTQEYYPEERRGRGRTGARRQKGAPKHQRTPSEAIFLNCDFLPLNYVMPLYQEIFTEFREIKFLPEILQNSHQKNFTTFREINNSFREILKTHFLDHPSWHLEISPLR